MRHCWLVLLAIVALLSPVAADCLVYRLPEDGSFARFDLEIKEQRGDDSKTATGSFTMSSVGAKEVDGKKCRWIEIKMIIKQGEREQVQIVKVLTPEEHLKAGSSAIEHMIKGWAGRPGKEARAVEGSKDRRLGPVSAFLCGPFMNAKKLPAMEIDTKVGKFTCTGVTGSIKIEQDKTVVEVVFDNRLSDKAPFGVVSSNMKYKATRADGETRDQGTVSLKLVEVGKNAKSDLPDSQ
ncbi:MAG: hypothetical protein FJ271_14260 [Planctomycetes bacterium]|nr:hypothetical protein [Planctomycetota bacterium]